jgi:hypothetical protein
MRGGSFRARPTTGLVLMVGVGGLIALGLLWPGAIIDGHRGLQVAATLATLGWMGCVVVLARSELSISDGVLRVRRVRTQQVDLRDLRWVALSPEAPEPRTADARGYQQWVIMLGDGDGRVATIEGPVPFPIWTRTRELLELVVGTVESSGALISERNWDMLRRRAGMEPRPHPRVARGAGWVHRFEWNSRSAAKVSLGIALIGIWPVAWVALAALDGLIGLPTVVAGVFGVVMVGYAWRHHTVAGHRGFDLHPDGVIRVTRRVGFLKLQLVEEQVDLSRAVQVEVRRVREVIRQGFRWILTVRDAAGGSTDLPLGEGLVPPARFWAQAREPLERSGVEIPEAAAEEIERLTGRSTATRVLPAPDSG